MHSRPLLKFDEAFILGISSVRRGGYDVNRNFISHIQAKGIEQGSWIMRDIECDSFPVVGPRFEYIQPEDANSRGIKWKFALGRPSLRSKGLRGNFNGLKYVREDLDRKIVDVAHLYSSLD